MQIMRYCAYIGLCAVCAGCSVEKRCHSGVEEVFAEYRAMHNAEDGARKYDRAIVQAGMHVNEAQTQEATRNFEGCVESLDAAREALARARAAAADQ